ncbi:MAG: hypothetical protein ACI8Y6_000485 [Brevundimonas sp.]|jgi:hypothetical protein
MQCIDIIDYFRARSWAIVDLRVETLLTGGVNLTVFLTVFLHRFSPEKVSKCRTCV